MVTQKELHKRMSVVPATKRVEGVGYGPTLIVVDEQPPGYQNRAARRQAPYQKIIVEMTSTLNEEDEPFYTTRFELRQKDWDAMLQKENCTLAPDGSIRCVETNELEHLTDKTVNTYKKV